MYARLVTILLVTLATALPAQAQTKYEIKIKKLAQGESELVEKTEVVTSTAKLVDKDGKELKDLSQPKKETKFAFRETILEKPAGAKFATKVKRQYTLATVTSDGKTMTLSYQGKTVIIEKKDGDYLFTLEGGEELKGEDAALLRKDFNKKRETEPDMEKLILPKGPIAVGDSWQPDTATIIKEANSEGTGPVFEETGAKGSGKLIKVYKKNGRQFGVLHFEITLAVKEIKGLEVEKGTQLVIRGDLDVCIDGTSTLGEMKGSFGMELRGRIAGQETGVQSSTRNTVTEVHKAAGSR